MTQPPGDSPFDERHLTVIEPPSGWRMLDLRELWAYRELFWVLALRDVRVRYKQTALGAGWAVIRPLALMLIFTLVFGRLANIPSDGFPYPLFVYAGLLPWTFFSSAVSTSGQSVVGSAHLISKVYFPRLVVPIASVGAAIVDLLISTALLMAMMAWYGVGWTAQLWAAPALMVLLVVTAMGIGTLLAALTVAYRDFSHLTPFLLQVWMYATPIVFPVSLVPPSWRWLLFANPLTGLVEGFRSAFLGAPFAWGGLALSLVMAVVLLAVGVAWFERVERRFADII